MNLNLANASNNGIIFYFESIRFERIIKHFYSKYNIINCYLKFFILIEFKQETPIPDCPLATPLKL